jgi:AmmeMemoRadiSam system protein B
MSQHTTPSIRPAAVAGAFYSRNPAGLARDVEAFLAEAKPMASRPKALIVPHAGYIYSGPVAATAYVGLRDLEPKPRRVVLLGPAHHVAFQGLALPGVDALETPLGVVPLDQELVAIAKRFPFIHESVKVHEREHSLEVQLPFLQRVLGDFTVLPLAVGRVETADVKQLLDAVWGGDETLIVVSSDLSHYRPYLEARAFDKRTAARIIAFEHEALDGHQACGVYPVRGLLAAAKERGLVSRLLDLRTSGDTAGDKGRVVGYGSFAFLPELPEP